MSEVIGLDGKPLDNGEIENKVAGAISPPAYKNVPQMLRNIADDVENGVYGGINTAAMALWCDEGMVMFSGGKDSDLAHSHMVFAAAANNLLNIVNFGAGTD